MSNFSKKSQIKMPKLKAPNFENSRILPSRDYGFALVLMIGLSTFSWTAEARVVNSIEDRERLMGWDSHQKFKNDVDADRLHDVGEVEEARKEFQDAQAKDLVEYRKWKAEQKASIDESSPEYKKDLQEKIDTFLAQDKKREQYIGEREHQRKLAQSDISLTEETELGLNEDRLRVDWEARNVLAEKDKMPGSPSAGRSGGAFGTRPGSPSNNDSGGGRSNYIPPQFDAPPPPPPMSPPAEFFEPDIPPGGGEGFDIPPPPPPGMDEGPPPPVFDDDF